MTSVRSKPEDFLTALGREPDIYLHNLDLVNRRALLIALSKAEYRHAAFLDDRVLKPQTSGAWFPLESILEHLTRVPATTSSPHFIFHIGHCGSTLVSRLLGELTGCFALREPLPLLALTYSRRELSSPLSRLRPQQWEQILSAVIQLLSQNYRPVEQSIVKATSTCADLIEPLIDRYPQTRALVLYVDLETYLATMLRAQSTRESARANSELWLSVLHTLTGSPTPALYELSDALHVAVGWLGAMIFFSRAARLNPERVQIVNFDEFLLKPVTILKKIMKFFRLSGDDQVARALVTGPLMQAYAKIPGQRFNAQVRRAELHEAEQQFAGEIEAGVRWARQLMDSTSALNQLKRFEFRLTS